MLFSVFAQIFSRYPLFFFCFISSVYDIFIHFCVNLLIFPNFIPFAQAQKKDQKLEIAQPHLLIHCCNRDGRSNKCEQPYHANRGITHSLSPLCHIHNTTVVSCRPNFSSSAMSKLSPAMIHPSFRLPPNRRWRRQDRAFSYVSPSALFSVRVRSVRLCWFDFVRLRSPEATGPGSIGILPHLIDQFAKFRSGNKNTAEVFMEGDEVYEYCIIEFMAIDCRETVMNF